MGGHKRRRAFEVFALSEKGKKNEISEGDKPKKDEGYFLEGSHESRWEVANERLEEVLGHRDRGGRRGRTVKRGKRRIEISILGKRSIN